MMVETQSLLTKKDAAERLRVSERTIDRLRARKKLRSVLVGAQVRFQLEDVEAYVLTNRVLGVPTRAERLQSA